MNDSEGEVQQAGYAAFESGGRVLDLLAALIDACSIQADRVEATTDAACITITELADTLVREEGLSFRQAHEIAATTSRAVIAAGKPLRDGFSAFSGAFLAHTQRPTTMTEPGFKSAVSAETFVAVRDRIGGPAPLAMDNALAHYTSELAALTDRQSAVLQHEETARNALQQAFDKLMQE
jgi:argininosuccinate lyase